MEKTGHNRKIDKKSKVPFKNGVPRLNLVVSLMICYRNPIPSLISLGPPSNMEKTGHNGKIDKKSKVTFKNGVPRLNLAVSLMMS